MVGVSVGAIVGLQTNSVREAFTGQTALQLIVALLMFGYYLGIALVEHRSYAQFMSGFLSGSLLFAFWYFLTSNGVGFFAYIGVVGGLIGGLYFGLTRPFLNDKKLDNLVKLAINGEVGLYNCSGFRFPSPCMECPESG